jgi:formate hydrogenlyase subunit 6/NADH:ubiquinone oxidoreductase subunit I
LNCERACPQAVIRIIKTKSGDPKPKINLKGCISCFTCIEICPEACYKTRLKHRGKFIAIGVSLFVIIALAITLGLIL